MKKEDNIVTTIVNRTYKTSEAPIKIKCKELWDRRVDITKRYVHRASIMEHFSNKDVNAILAYVDETPHRGYINYSDFILIASRADDATFYLDVQKQGVKQTSASKYLSNMKMIDTVSRFVFENDKYKQLTEELDWYNGLQNDMLHFAENTKQTASDMLIWAKDLERLRKERREIKNERLWRHTAKTLLSHKFDKISTLQQTLQPITKHTGVKAYRPRVAGLKLKAWKDGGK